MKKCTPEQLPARLEVDFRKNRGIVIHHSWKPTIAVPGRFYGDIIERYHVFGRLLEGLEAFLYCGYDAVISNVGGEQGWCIEYSERWSKQINGAHCRGYNDMVGICLIGNFDKGYPSIFQEILLMRTLKRLLEFGKIPLSQVYPHSQFSIKTCPGRKFPLTNMKFAIRNGNFCQKRCPDIEGRE